VERKREREGEMFVLIAYFRQILYFSPTPTLAFTKANKPNKMTNSKGINITQGVDTSQIFEIFF